MQISENRIPNIAGHLIFWALSAFVLVLVFNTTGKLQKIDLVYVTIFHFSVVPLFYLTGQLLVPKFFSRQKYYLFALLSAVSLIVFAGFSQLLFNRYADFIFPGFYFVSTFSFIHSLLVHFIYLSISILIILSGSWFRETETRKKLISMEKEKIQAELQMLKSQVNPHFFFNTLQSLYALALKKEDKLPGMILKLSDLMRYVIYESETDKIMISKEITFLNNYLELQKLRLTANADLRVEVHVENDEIRVPPLLLIHFVENCFKHGLKGEAGKVYAHIRLEADQKMLYFQTRNNRKPEKYVNPKKGTGLDNVKRRLELHYPGRYHLKINEQESSFETELNIDLS